MPKVPVFYCYARTTNDNSQNNNLDAFYSLERWFIESSIHFLESTFYGESDAFPVIGFQVSFYLFLEFFSSFDLMYCKDIKANLTKMLFHKLLECV